MIPKSPSSGNGNNYQCLSLRGYSNQKLRETETAASAPMLSASSTFRQWNGWKSRTDSTYFNTAFWFFICKPDYGSCYNLAESRVLWDRKTVGAEGMHMDSTLLQMIHTTQGIGSKMQTDENMPLSFSHRRHLFQMSHAWHFQVERDSSMSFHLVCHLVSSHFLSALFWWLSRMTQNCFSCSFRLVLPKFGNS